MPIDLFNSLVNNCEMVFKPIVVTFTFFTVFPVTTAADVDAALDALAHVQALTI